MTIKENVLYADEGKYLTDGVIFAKTVYLAVGADASLWYEVDESEYPKGENEF